MQTKQQQQKYKQDTQLEATLLICFVFAFDFLLFILECNGICFQFFLMYLLLGYVNKPKVSFRGHTAVSAVVSFLKLSPIILKNIMHHILNIHGGSPEWYSWKNKNKMHQTFQCHSANMNTKYEYYSNHVNQT